MELVFAMLLVVGGALIAAVDRSENKWFREVSALVVASLAALFIVNEPKFFEQIVMGSTCFILLYIIAIIKKEMHIKRWANILVCLGAATLFLESNLWISKPELFLAKIILLAIMLVLPALILAKAPMRSLQFERMMGMYSLFHLLIRTGLIYLAISQSFEVLSEEIKVSLQVTFITIAGLVLLLALRRKAQHWWLHSQVILSFFILSGCLWADQKQSAILFLLTIGSMVSDAAFVTENPKAGFENSILKTFTSLGLGSGAMALVLAMEIKQRKVNGEFLSLSWVLMFILLASLSWMRLKIDNQKSGWSKRDILLALVQVMMWVAGIAAASESWGRHLT